MEGTVSVDVYGPRLLAQSICALLRDFPDIQAAYGAAPAGPAEQEQKRCRVRLILLFGTLPSASPNIPRQHPTVYGRRSTDFHFYTESQTAPELTRLAAKRTAVIFAGAEAEMLAACERGLEVFLSPNDEPRTIHQGVLAAARAQPFCSPLLTSLFMQAVRARSARREEASELSDRGPLSRRESEVAELAAAGLSNEEIGERLHVSVHTVKTHMCQILRKMGLRRRSQIRNTVLTQESLLGASYQAANGPFE